MISRTRNFGISFRETWAAVPSGGTPGGRRGRQLLNRQGTRGSHCWAFQSEKPAVKTMASNSFPILTLPGGLWADSEAPSRSRGSSAADSLKHQAGGGIVSRSLLRGRAVSVIWKYFRAGSSKFADREPALRNPAFQSRNLVISNEESWGLVPSGRRFLVELRTAFWLAGGGSGLGRRGVR